jgi:RNA polymerase sigma factor (sigma-70 family)
MPSAGGIIGSGRNPHAAACSRYAARRKYEPFSASADFQGVAETTVMETAGPDPRARKEDELLVVRCQLGERTAFDEMVQRWHEPLGRFVRRLVGNDEAAKDVTQDIWLRVLRGVGRLSDGSKLRPWLFSIARRSLMDRLRAQYATPVEQDFDVTAVPIVPPASDLGEEMAVMQHELARLPIIEREVLELFYLQELSLGEVAEALDVPVGTVKSRLFRARHMLRRGLDSKGTRA